MKVAAVTFKVSLWRASSRSVGGQTGIEEMNVPHRDPSLELRLPVLPYGSVWLIGAGDCDHHNLSPLAVQALGAADAVIHDPGVSKTILDLTKPSGYREAATPHRAIDRLIKLARNGWRVVHLVEDNTMERSVESSIRCAEHNIPLCILPNTGDSIGAEAPLGFLLVRQTLLVGRANPRSTLVVLAASPQSEAELEIVQCQPPLDFSMPGLAG